MNITALLIMDFLISFIGNALPFFGEAYTVYAALTLLGIKSPMQYVVLVIAVTAIGASISKNVSYALGYALRKPLRRTSAVKLIMLLSNKAPLCVLVIILAALPGLPLDDYLYISTGAASINLAKLNAYILIGKLIKGSVEIPIELLLFSSLYGLLKPSMALSTFQLVMAVLFTALAFVIFKIDWIKIYAKLQRRINILPKIDEF
ncbi:hypothetical protein [Vulcanisaeta distributa]|uniref:SNARE associated Golgi protein-related protein n=1 Tax=Vulcanisaeta distributa (strain DSM 14429 / JCM 11212 / NBRC 100878 / IC-017) TaxID=572478 RepID=E1QP25_VULDI|nr:hypothetical protein [Vulcanisaeta distributa]ADN51390.1 conserved hypothetical protein [Vulcanisaeta distributa DSM 14429]